MFKSHRCVRVPAHNFSSEIAKHAKEGMGRSVSPPSAVRASPCPESVVLAQRFDICAARENKKMPRADLAYLQPGSIFISGDGKLPRT